MRSRVKKLTIPEDNARYFKVDLGGDIGEIQFKNPVPSTISKLMLAMEKEGMIPKSKEEIKKIKNTITPEKANESIILGLAAIGACWCDPEQELEARFDRRNPDWVEYGYDVEDELAELGWDTADFATAAKVILPNFVRRLQPREIRDRINFSQAQREAIN